MSSRSSERLLVEALLLRFEGGQVIEPEFGFEAILGGVQRFSSTTLALLEFFADNTAVLCWGGPEMQLLNPKCCESTFWEFLIENEVSVLGQWSLFRWRTSFNNPSAESGLTPNKIHRFEISFMKACRTPTAGSTFVQTFGNTDEQEESWLLYLTDGFTSESVSTQSWLAGVLAENLKGCSDDAFGEVLLRMTSAGFVLCVCRFSLWRHSFLAPTSQGSYSLCLFWNECFK